MVAASAALWVGACGDSGTDPSEVLTEIQLSIPSVGIQLPRRVKSGRLLRRTCLEAILEVEGAGGRARLFEIVRDRESAEHTRVGGALSR